ncbi:TPA: recombinase zinc beta ribbon domain-containing protein, partial [Streptococcus pneumoniae]
IIKNEKYKGDILMGKTFTVDPISKRRLINFGEEDKYYIKNNHDAIISPEIFTQAQEIRLRRSGNKKTIANTKGKRERYSRMYPFSSRLECGFCGTVLSRRSWHSSSEYKKIIWHCTTSIKKGKKHCIHSKGIEEKAIENAFLQSYQQLFYENNNLTEDFLEIIKEELTDDTLKVELNKIVSKLNSLYKKEEKLVSMNLDGKISDSVYEDKFNQIQIEKEKLLEEKVNLEVTLKSEVDIKSRLENFKEILTSQKTLTEFDKDIFDSIVEKIIVGGINSDGEIDPAMLTIIFKTGDSSTKDAKSYKSKRKNAKIENDKLCFNTVTDDEKKCTNKENNARRDGSTFVQTRCR